MIKQIRFWLLKKLLKSYVTKDMDQWDMFKMDTRFGPVYINISRQPQPGTKDRHFDQV